MFCFQYPFGTADFRVNGTGENMCVIFDRFFHLRHPLQNFFPGACKGGFFRFMFKAFDEFFQTFDFFLLLFPCFGLKGVFFLFLRLKRGVISNIAVQFPVLKFPDGICRAVQEKAVMGYHNDSSRITAQIIFQPFNGLYIQMVGRFIQQQEIRFLQKQTDHCDFSLFASGKLFKPLLFIFLCKTKAGKDPVVFLLPCETLPVPFIRTGAAFQKFFFHRDGQIGKCLLGQKTGGCLSGSIDFRGNTFIVPVKCQFTGKKSKQGSLTASVSTDDGNFFVSADFKMKMGQNRLTADA